MRKAGDAPGPVAGTMVPVAVKMVPVSGTMGTVAVNDGHGRRTKADWPGTNAGRTLLHPKLITSPAHSLLTTGPLDSPAKGP